LPWSLGGRDTLANLRPACKRCNSRRQNRVISGIGCTINVLIGPPGSGKSTYVAEHAGPDDVVIDLDAIARALMPVQPTRTHSYPQHVRHVAIGARKAAIDRATRLAFGGVVWLIHSVPSEATMGEYRALRYNVITIDPGREVVEQRVASERPAFVGVAVAKWYASPYAAASEARSSESVPIVSSVPQPADFVADW
jgi:hypothetical protein